MSNVLERNLLLLRDNYHTTIEALERTGICYHPAKGGLSLVLDLRRVCAKLGSGWEAEEKLHDMLVTEAKVQLAPGRGFGNFQLLISSLLILFLLEFEEPGYFRLTFTEAQESLTSAVERMAMLFDQKGLRNVAVCDSIVRRFQALWRRTDAIFSLLTPEAMYEKPINLRHPFIFYLGHIPAFWWNQVCYCYGLLFILFFFIIIFVALQSS